MGSVLCYTLLNRGHHVSCIDSSIYGNAASTMLLLGNAHFEFKNLDFCDHFTFENIINDPDNVIILAGLVGDPITKNTLISQIKLMN